MLFIASDSSALDRLSIQQVSIHRYWYPLALASSQHSRILRYPRLCPFMNGCLRGPRLCSFVNGDLRLCSFVSGCLRARISSKVTSSSSASHLCDTIAYFVRAIPVISGSSSSSDIDTRVGPLSDTFNSHIFTTAMKSERRRDAGRDAILAWHLSMPLSKLSRSGLHRFFFL